MNSYSEMSILEKLKSVGDNEIYFGNKYDGIKDAFVAVNENGVVAILFKFKDHDDDLTETKKFTIKVYEDNELSISKTLDKSDYGGLCLDNEKLALFSTNIVSDSETVTSLVKLYDLSDLKLLKSKSFNNKIKNIEIFEGKIFLTRECSDAPFIFDESLNLLGKLELEITHPCSSFSKIVISGNKIFAERKRKFCVKNSSTFIDIYNENDGLLQSSFNLEDSFEMVSISNKTSEIITCNLKEKIIRVYKIDGTIVEELDVSQFPHIDHVCMNESGKIVIIDKRSKKIYSN